VETTENANGLAKSKCKISFEKMIRSKNFESDSSNLWTGGEVGEQ